MESKYIRLYGDLHEEFKLIEIENANLQEQWKEYRKKGMSDEEVYELKGSEDYDLYKDQIRRILWIIDRYHRGTSI